MAQGEREKRRSTREMQPALVDTGDARMPLDVDSAEPTNVAVVIAAFNEGPVIQEVVREIQPYSDLIIVVDDGSRDATGALAAAEGATVVRHAINRGQGAALQTGITVALCSGVSYIVTFDADGQHRGADIPKLLSPLQNDSNAPGVVLGSRFLERSDVPFRRRVLLRLATIFTRLVSGISVTDTHNGLRAFRREAAERLVISQDRMAHASEILDEIGRLGIRFVEVPVRIQYSEYSRRKGQSGFSAVRVLFDYMLGRWTK